MKLSKTIRRNPTQTTTLQNEYARALRRLFITYRKGAIEAFDELSETKIHTLEKSKNVTAIVSLLKSITKYSNPLNPPLYRPLAETLAAADVDIITLDNVLGQLGVQLVTSGAEITGQQTWSNYTAGTNFGSMALKRIGVEAVIGIGPADWRVIDALKVRNLSALRGISDEMNKQIIRELTDGINLGESIPKLRDRLAGRIDNIGKHRATVMARTETLNAFNQGAEVRYAQAGIEKLEWLAALDDGRRCDECAAMDGKVFSIKSGHVRPPLHPQCRCTVIPVIES